MRKASLSSYVVSVCVGQRLSWNTVRLTSSQNPKVGRSIKAARERKKLKLAPASGADRTNHEEHSNKIVGAKKSSLEKSMPMLV